MKGKVVTYYVTVMWRSKYVAHLTCAKKRMSELVSRLYPFTKKRDPIESKGSNGTFLRIAHIVCDFGYAATCIVVEVNFNSS